MNAILRVGVVLVNWNSRDLTGACIRSLQAGTAKPWRIVVYDNASGDGSAEAVRNEFPLVTLIQGRENIGFTGANNIGIRHLLDAGADLIWVLNNDTVVEAKCLRVLHDALSANPRVAAVSGKIWSDAATRRLWYAGGTLNTLTFTASHAGIGRVDRGQYDAPRDVTFISGCCMLARQEIFREIGVFDDRYFAYYEDVEWCLRARRGGYVLRYVPAATLFHKIMGSLSQNASACGGRFSPTFHRLTARNRLLTIRAHGHSVWRMAIALACYGVYTLYLLAGFAVRGRREKIRALVRGIGEGLRLPPAGLQAGLAGK